MKFKAFALLATTILSGCASVSVNSTFDPNAAAFINQQGKGVVTGQGFLRRNDGVVVYAAGSEVQLIPKTPYSDARIAAIFKGAKMAPAAPLTGTPVTVKNDDPQFKAYTRTVIANGEGRFTFPNVPDGNYYITAPVIWYVQAPQGGTLLATVTVSGGQPVDVIMNGM